MFKFLKEKLKNALSKFTKKVEEEVVEEPVREIKEVKEKIKEEVKEKPKKVKEVKEKKEIKEKEEKPKKEVEKVKEEEPKKKIEEVKEKPKEEVPPDEVKITYFVHGTSTDNAKETASGHADVALSKLGIEQSKKLGEEVKDEFDIVFCSDLKRAVDTANLAFKRFKIIKDKRLRETDYGDYTRKSTKEFKKDMNKYIDNPFPNGESYKDVEKRIAEFLNEIYEKYKGKHIAIIAHQAPQLALDVLIKGKTWQEAIKEDWRIKKEWQPGWVYNLKGKVEFKEPEKKGFFKRIFHKKEVEPEEKIEEKVEEVKPKEEKEEIEEKEEEIKEVKEEIKEEPEKKGFFKRVGETFTKVSLSEQKFDEIFWDLEVALLENNVALEVIEKIKEDLKEKLTKDKIPRGNINSIIISSLKNSIEDLFDVEKVNLIKEIKKKKPYIIIFVGVNGSGKTTNMMKFADLCLKNKLKPVVAACDTFRAAAIQQLEEHASKLNVKLIKHDYGSDAAAVAFDAIEHAKAKNYDVVLIDTAGRSHSNVNLMDELKKVIRVSQPDFIVFVGDSLTGNDAVEQAKTFNESVGIDGIILAKTDVDDKGGAFISVSYVTGKPILYIGTGQTYADIKEFDSKIVVDGLGLA